ncbi:glycosyl transferase family 2 [Oceanidesulfovibrio marinus]|uniref:Glycosyl transferase family 2 n=1 Tax=Oceanidesulfovibrio marinus TaxID=370038 RepID=A0A6P1ZKH1_9BACT|nr:glycosyl transferase family 2 [Oceanidesulfovibrio marinus]QJT09801.1 glycosyl transferase family 2 [Oceanidesulfovibrio marinus]TVM36083.1 glycosyl transferase family 2 [Oceanidesulfovibrio marinus]
MHPAIVVATHNRPRSLMRVLSSLKRGIGLDDVTLIISIDPDGADVVLATAEAFSWEFGPKRIIAHSDHLGLRRHLLSCGDLSQEYGAVIVIEDDLFVSPWFYEYASQALGLYGADARISGVSLYAPLFNETAELGFTPLNAPYDGYFMQLPSSWGQAFTAAQWKAFKTWLAAQEGEPDIPVPWNVEGWSQHSWKKLLLMYMLAADTYYAYPYLGLSTNFSTPGSHHFIASTHLQTPLRMHGGFSLPTLDESPAVYDVFGELLPERMTRLAPWLEDYDFEVDLYGKKFLNRVNSKFLLTAKPGVAPVRTFGRSLKPHELNIAFDSEGDTFRLVRTNECSEHLVWPNKDSLSYYFNVWRRCMDHQYVALKSDLPVDYFERLLPAGKSRS